MAKKPADEQDLLFREVDDDIRQDKLTEYWKRYGRYVIGGAVGIVLAVSGMTIYDGYLDDKESAASDAFVAALEKASEDGADASVVWTEAAAKLEGGYAALAKLNEAAALVDTDKEAALSILNSFTLDESHDEVLRGLGQLLAARTEVDLGLFPEARGRLSLISNQGGVWRYSALETLAVVDLAEGNNEAAYSAFLALSAEPGPQSIISRAREMTDALRAYAPKPDPITETPAETIPSSENSDEDNTESTDDGTIDDEEQS